jgi:hypothetical protein
MYFKLDLSFYMFAIIFLLDQIRVETRESSCWEETAASLGSPPDPMCCNHADRDPNIPTLGPLLASNLGPPPLAGGLGSPPPSSHSGASAPMPASPGRRRPLVG